MSIKRWRAVAPDLMRFFQRDNGRITHQRLTKELQKSESKSQSRASAGAEGGRAKALKDKNASLANATGLPWHLPEARDHIENIPAAQQIDHAARPKVGELQRLLFEAAGIAGFREERHPRLMDLSPIYGLIDAGYDLHREILPVIRDRARNRTFSSWRFFTDAVIETATANRAIPRKQPEPTEDWQKRLVVWHQSRTWSHTWGPKPGEAGCKVPPELLRTAA